MGEHTPGPWQADADGIFIGTVDGDTLAEIFDPPGPDSIDRGQTNAHLIAAAPDLLEAARRAHDAIGMPVGHPLAQKARRLLRHAIAKAEGRVHDDV